MAYEHTIKSGNFHVMFAGRMSACKRWVENNGVGEIWPDYDGCWQVRVYRK